MDSLGFSTRICDVNVGPFSDSLTILSPLDEALERFVVFVRTRDYNTSPDAKCGVHEMTVTALSAIRDQSAKHLVETSKDDLAVAQFVSRVLCILSTALKMLSRLYGDPASQAIFMMNNLHHVLKQLRGSGSLDTVNLLNYPEVTHYTEDISDWIRKFCSFFWSRVLRSLDAALAHQVGSVPLKKKEKKKVKLFYKVFNGEFGAAKRSQANFVIADYELQEKLFRGSKLLIEHKYYLFHEKFSVLPFSKNKQKHILHHPANIQFVLKLFFDGLVLNSYEVPVPNAQS